MTEMGSTMSCKSTTPGHCPYTKDVAHSRYAYPYTIGLLDRYGYGGLRPPSVMGHTVYWNTPWE